MSEDKLRPNYVVFAAGHLKCLALARIGPLEIPGSQHIVFLLRVISVFFYFKIIFLLLLWFERSYFPMTI